MNTVPRRKTESGLPPFGKGVFLGNRALKRNMTYKKSVGLLLALLLASTIGAPVAQATAHQPTDEVASAAAHASRVTGDWQTTASVAIPTGKTPSRASEMDLGAAPADIPLTRMLLLLEPSAAQRQALDAELANQQNPASSHYHQWLTAAAFASSYANSAADVAAVVSWLQGQGFQVAPLPAGLGWVEFSGTAGQVEQAFHTHLDLLATAAGSRAVLASAINVPAALKPVLHGLVSLDGAVSLPALTTPQPVAVSAASLAAQTTPSQAEALTPRLMAQLLHWDALQASAVNGAGETIAIAARSNVAPSDIAAFRAVFGLPANPLAIAPNGIDPGITSDEAEAVLAASWAGAAAPGAQILLVPAATTGATDGLDLSLAAIVDQALAHAVAVGYSSCEASLSEAHQAFYAALYRQAAAEGIAVIAAAGDSGPSACHIAGSPAPVSSGYGVNALASTPWNTAVGVAGLSADESGTTGRVASSPTLAGWSPTSAADPVYAGGGGSSTLYAAPSWQPLPSSPAVAATPEGHFRLLPDAALPTAIDSGAHHGLAFCMSCSASAGECTLVRGGGSAASAAIFAGVAALVAQKNGPQGNLAPHLYALSRRSGVFDDVQQGGAQLWCRAGSPGCGDTEQIGFAAVPGYDLATGLGGVNAQALVTNWSAVPEVGTSAVTVGITAQPAIITPSTLVTLTAKVTPGAGGATPTGTVLFYNISSGTNVSTAPSTVGADGTASLSISGVFALGDNKVEAIYSGDATYASATSQPVDIAVEKSATVTSLTATPAVLTTGTTETFNATIAPATATGATYSITGKVSFYDGATLLGAGTVTANAASLANITLSTTASHTITAVYSGDTAWNTSTSSAVTLGSTAPDTVTLTITPAMPTLGQTVSIVATVTPLAAPPATGEQNPTGNVVFYSGTTVLGTVALVASANNTATATFTSATLAGGEDTITAVYAGDTYYSPGTSAPLNTNVQGFTIAPSSANPSANLTIVQGSAGSASFTVAGVGGFNGQIQVVCTVPQQDDMTCLASPQQVTPTATVTFTVQTFAASSSVAAAGHAHEHPWPRAAGETALALLGFFLLPFGRRTRVFSNLLSRRLVPLLLLLVGLSGAGIGCSNSVKVTSSSGTPLGVATLTITASTYENTTPVSRSVYLTVNVVAPGSPATSNGN